MRSPGLLFDHRFASEELKNIYFESIRGNPLIGVDRVNRRSFERKLSENLEIASRKSLQGTYTFSSFREKLILKSRESPPRIISIPTLRDKVVLKALHTYLHEIVSQTLDLKSIHATVADVRRSIASKQFDYVLKFDIKDFYPSVKHHTLRGQVEKLVSEDRAVELISRAISRATCSLDTITRDSSTSGLPQGLPISNLLANIYLLDFDRKHRPSLNYRFFRYVDDILVLCNERDAKKIETVIRSDLEKIDLEVNELKCTSNILSKEFHYLGYSFSQGKVSVKKTTFSRLVSSIAQTFAQHKYSDSKTLEILRWKLNMRITGFIVEKRRYGWLFFYSQIDDLKLLSSLDHLVTKLAKRFGIVPEDKKFKKFVRSFHEISSNLTQTKYIPKLDEWDVDEKRRVLRDIFDVAESRLIDDNETESLFTRKMFLMIKDIEKDLRRAS